MEMQKVVSGNIAEVGFEITDKEKETGSLYVKFKSGTTYRYKEVTAEVVQDFVTAESIGKFFGSEIKDKYETFKLVKPDPIEGQEWDGKFTEVKV